MSKAAVGSRLQKQAVLFCEAPPSLLWGLNASTIPRLHTHQLSASQALSFLSGASASRPFKAENWPLGLSQPQSRVLSNLAAAWMLLCKPAATSQLWTRRTQTDTGVTLAEGLCSQQGRSKPHSHVLKGVIYRQLTASLKASSNFQA